MPHVCPRCGTQYDDQTLVCWPCRAHLVPDPSPASPIPEAEGTGGGTDPVWVDYRPVYLAPDEFTALAVQCLLEGSGIESRVRSEQIPWTDGIMRNIIGYWGQVLVPLAEVVRARALVDAYLKTLERGSPKTPESAEDGSEESAGGDPSSP